MSDPQQSGEGVRSGYAPGQPANLEGGIQPLLPAQTTLALRSSLGSSSPVVEEGSGKDQEGEQTPGKSLGEEVDGPLGKRARDVEKEEARELTLRNRRRFSSGMPRALSMPQSINLEQAHMDSPRGMERKQSDANRHIISAADDLKELEGGWAERKRKMSVTLDVHTAHKDAPPNLERKQSAANMYMACAADDLKELGTSQSVRPRSLSISVDKAHLNAPPGLERQPSEANLHISSAEDDLKQLDSEQAAKKRKFSETLSIDLKQAHQDAPPGLQRRQSLANYYMASVSADLEELHSMVGRKPRNRTLSISLGAAQATRPAAFQRLASAANMYIASAEDDLKELDRSAAKLHAEEGGKARAGLPLAIDVRQAHSLAPPGLERQASEANLYMSSAADDLKDLEAESSTSTSKRSRSLAISVTAAHSNAPPGLERAPSRANLYMASAAEDLKALEEGARLKGRGMSISVEEAHSGAPPGLARIPSDANLYRSSAEDDLKELESGGSGGRSWSRSLSIDVEGAHKDAPPGLERQPSNANLHRACAEKDMKELERLVKSAKSKGFVRTLSVNVSKAVASGPAAFERMRSDANLYMTSAEEDLKQLEELTRGNGGGKGTKATLRPLHVPLKIDLDKAHMASPRGLERKPSAANRYIASAADDLKALEDGHAEGGERKTALSVSRTGSAPTAIDIDAAHRDSPPGLERKPSEANLYVSSAADDLKELEDAASEGAREGERERDGGDGDENGSGGGGQRGQERSSEGECSARGDENGTHHNGESEGGGGGRRFVGGRVRVQTRIWMGGPLEERNGTVGWYVESCWGARDQNVGAKHVEEREGVWRVALDGHRGAALDLRWPELKEGLLRYTQHARRERWGLQGLEMPQWEEGAEKAMELTDLVPGAIPVGATVTCRGKTGVVSEEGDIESRGTTYANPSKFAAAAGCKSNGWDEVLFEGRQLSSVRRDFQRSLQSLGSAERRRDAAREERGDERARARSEGGDVGGGERPGEKRRREMRGWREEGSEYLCMPLRREKQAGPIAGQWQDGTVMAWRVEEGGQEGEGPGKWLVEFDDGEESDEMDEWEVLEAALRHRRATEDGSRLRGLKVARVFHGLGELLGVVEGVDEGGRGLQVCFEHGFEEMLPSSEIRRSLAGWKLVGCEGGDKRGGGGAGAVGKAAQWGGAGGGLKDVAPTPRMAVEARKRGFQMGKDQTPTVRDVNVLLSQQEAAKHTLHLNQLVECEDDAGLYMGRVIQIDTAKKRVKIHFLGWNSRHDRWVPVNSTRIRIPAESDLLEAQLSDDEDGDGHGAKEVGRKPWWRENSAGQGVPVSAKTPLPTMLHSLCGVPGAAVTKAVQSLRRTVAAPKTPSGPSIIAGSLAWDGEKKGAVG